MIYAFVVVFIFSATSVVFILYDYMVQRRQRKVMQSAESANAIVSSIFPQNVKERLLQTAEEKVNKKSVPTKQGAGFAFGAQKQLKGTHSSVEFEKEEPDGLVTPYSTKPIADLFTHATVMFADIAGFTGTSSGSYPSGRDSRLSYSTCELSRTAWSSEREASQGKRTIAPAVIESPEKTVCADPFSLLVVFVLLETVYASFDKVAKALKVFKVETIGTKQRDKEQLRLSGWLTLWKIQSGLSCR
jgi:hypothetical protein